MKLIYFAAMSLQYIYYPIQRVKNNKSAKVSFNDKNTLEDNIKIKC